MDGNDDKGEITPAQPPDQPLKNPFGLLSSAAFAEAGGCILLKNPKCKLCNFSVEIRRHAEGMFDEKRSLPEIKAYLDTKGSEYIIATSTIRHHMIEHYRTQERMLILSEYCDDMTAIMSRRKDKLEELMKMDAICDIELGKAVSFPTDGNPDKIALRHDMVIKTLKMKKDIMDAMISMASSQDEIKAIEGKFLSIFKKKIEESQNDEERRTLCIEIVREFQKEYNIEPPKEG